MGQCAAGCQCQPVLGGAQLAACGVWFPRVDGKFSEICCDNRFQRADATVDCAVGSSSRIRAVPSVPTGNDVVNVDEDEDFVKVFHAAIPVGRRFGWLAVQDGDFHEAYNLEKHLASGSFAGVYEASLTNSCREGGPQRMAVKKFELSQGRLPSRVVSARDGASDDASVSARRLRRLRCDVERELQALTRLEHPHILKMYECFASEDHMWLVLEGCAGGDLYGRILENTRSRGRDGGAHDEPAARHLMRQMLSSLRYLHDYNVVHCDVKPENFLLMGLPGTQYGDVLKLCDFGSAVWLTDDRPRATNSNCTLSYTPPEVYAKKGMSCCGDRWSIGVVLYAVLVGLSPFRDRADPKETTVRRILAGDFYRERPAWLRLSDDARDIIERFLIVDESTRLRCCEAQAHRWLDREDRHGSTSMTSSKARPRFLTPIASTKETLDGFSSYGPTLLSLLVRFANLDTLQKLIFVTCARVLPDSDVMSCTYPLPWYDLFFALDADMDGRLTFAELTAGLRELLGDGLFATSPDVSAVGGLLDLDCSGCIDWVEWVALALFANPELMSDEECLHMAFRVLDTASGDGIVSPDDLRGFLGNVGGVRTTFDVLRPWATGVLLDSGRASGGGTVVAEAVSPKGAPTLGMRFVDMQRAVAGPTPGMGWTSSTGGIAGNWSSPRSGPDVAEADGEVATGMATVLVPAKDSRDIQAVMQLEAAI